jgi:tetratricopeptide (TPR) repeat protein
MRRHLAIVALLPGLAWLAGPAAADFPDGYRCLTRADLGCAQAELLKAQVSAPKSPETLRLQALTRFHEGRYSDALAALDLLEAAGGQVDLPDAPIRETHQAAVGMIEQAGPGVRVRFAPGVDRVLATEALEAMEASRKVFDTLLGGGPPQDLVLDIFPTGSRFILASGLPAEDVRTTGVVALSKWNRLLLTSPRALARGYAWKDTVAHEYIHLVVSYRTGNKAPVWLQEGLAKFLEGYWRGERSHQLSVHQQGLLAKALRSGGFVPFEKFQRSMAYLDSGEEAALAFAQVATMVAFLVDKKGDATLARLLDRVAAGESAQDAIAKEAGLADFEAFRRDWREWLKTLPLVQQSLLALPVVLDGQGDDFAEDPLLAQQPEMARFVRLGDLLLDAGRPTAALVEYGKVDEGEGPPSPLLLARRATCHQKLGQLDQAIALAREGAKLYPEFTPVQTVLARLLDAKGDTSGAVVAWKASHDLNPYDPEVEAALVRGYTALGRSEDALRHQGYARLLASGGADPGGG